MDKILDLPSNTDDWTKEHVRHWVTEHLKIGQEEGDILYKENITGMVLNILTKEDFSDMKISFGSAKLILHKLAQINNTQKQSQAAPGKKKSEAMLDRTKKVSKNKNEKQKEEYATKTNKAEELSGDMINVNETQQYVSTDCLSCPRVSCTPYPFDTTHEPKRYTQHHFLPPESGPSNYIDPVHEYKELTKTEKATEEDKKMKFCNEVFRFAAACMNVRTNGTIHFGVRDKPHGEIIGVHVADREFYNKPFYKMMNNYFKKDQHDLAKQCIRPPRYVDVLHQDNTQSDLVVIEVDVVPEYRICNSQIFYTSQYTCTEKMWTKSKEICCFVRDGESSTDILANVKHKDADLKIFYSQMKDRDEARKNAEENGKKKQIKKAAHGGKLVSLITGGRETLDDSYFKWYILVTSKCHKKHTKHLDFLYELPWFAVLDFDSNSCREGLCKVYREKRVANLHFPHHFQNMDSTTDKNCQELKLFHQTSWIFCNGRVDLDSKEYKPLDNRMWHKEKAAEVRQLVTFLCRKDVMQPGKFLVVFLLLSAVDDQMDPINEVFKTFYQNLNGMTDILCICESEQTFQRWKDLQARFIAEEEMEERSVYNLDLMSINGTILKLKSSTRSSSRFLPSHGGSSTILHRKDEDLMTFLDILCANECEGTELEKNKPKFDELIKSKEEHFYRGGKATWWNFYFSSESYTGPFIERDIHQTIRAFIESCFSSDLKKSVMIGTLSHLPGCGGTTTAMHVLWELRKKFRCATLKSKTDNIEDTAKEVIRLATLGSASNTDYYPTLLLVDDYEEEEYVYHLQNCIRSTIAERSIKYHSPVVVLLHCMRSQKPEQTCNTNRTNSFALNHKISEKERRKFVKKLKDIEQRHEKPEDFYSFMIMKKNFNVKYIENVTRNILKGLDNSKKEAQLISFLALLNKYVNDSNISVSMCEEFLGMTVKPPVRLWEPETIEERLGPFSALIIRSEIKDNAGYKGLQIIHPLIAKQCIEEFKNNVQQSRIMISLLETNIFYETRIGREIFSKNVQSMLVTRHRKELGDEADTLTRHCKELGEADTVTRHRKELGEADTMTKHSKELGEADTLFSPLIENIRKQEGHESVEKVLNYGTVRFNQNPYIFQALARYFCIRKGNIDAAFHWARKAKQISPNNSFILNTLGQIHKTQLKIEMEKRGKPNLTTLLSIAENALKAFKECQEKTEAIEIERDEYEWATPKGSKGYNTAGYMGQIEVCLSTVDILFQLPWDPIAKQELEQCLSEKLDIFLNNQIRSYNEICCVLLDFRHLLTSLKSCLKEAFGFFERYFIFFKHKSVIKESSEFKIRDKFQAYYKKYTHFFCKLELTSDGTVLQKNSVPLLIQEHRKCLEFYKADRFSGILQYLNGHEKDVKSMKAIVSTYQYLLEKSTCSHQDKQNFILANIVLHCISPKPANIVQIEKLKDYLREVLQITHFDHRSSDPYFLASLLFWPQDKNQLDADSKFISKYIHSLRASSKGQYRHMHRAKFPIAHFYLTKNKGLDRIIHKGRIDSNFRAVPKPDLNNLWQDGGIWKEAKIAELLVRVHGRVEDGDIIVEHNSDETVKIPVRPAFLGELRSGKSIEQVSFYLGFSVCGPIAYDIESL